MQSKLCCWSHAPNIGDLQFVIVCVFLLNFSSNIKIPSPLLRTCFSQEGPISSNPVKGKTSALKSGSTDQREYTDKKIDESEVCYWNMWYNVLEHVT